MKCTALSLQHADMHLARRRVRNFKCIAGGEAAPSFLLAATSFTAVSKQYSALPLAWPESIHLVMPNMCRLLLPNRPSAASQLSMHARCCHA